MNRCRASLLGAVAALGLFAAGTAGQQRPHSRPTPEFEPWGLFLGNEGVALFLGPAPILLDGLFRDGVSGYQTIPVELREQFEGTFLTSEARLAVASHHHADHFDAAAVIAHLTANEDSRFVSTPNAVALIHELNPPSSVLERVAASLPPEGEREVFGFPALPAVPIRLETLNLHHGRARQEIQNLGHLIELGGIRVLHMGDTEVTAEEIMSQGIGADDLDAAFVPYWLLLGESGPGVLAALNARKVFAVHLPVPDVDPSWWGEHGSLAGTVEALELLEGVTALVEPGTIFDFN